MKRHKTSKKLVKQIDEEKLLWQMDFPEKVKVSECYISSVQYECYIKPYYHVEMAFKIEERWMNACVYMSITDLNEIFKRATNFSLRIKTENEELIEKLTLDGHLSFRELFTTYLHSEQIDLNLNQVKLQEEGRGIDNHNVYSVVGFEKYLSS